MYPVLAFIFFVTLATGLALLVGFLLKLTFWNSYGRRLVRGYAFWLALYGLFIFFGTGPVGRRTYMPPDSSPYKLPWKSGVSRFVSQGNRSFTSHRGRHEYAWDFWMKIGTEVLAARDGTVVGIEQSFEGLGLHSNFIEIAHDDGTHALYAHIRKNGATVKAGDAVKQGQLIAYSGMVGQTLNPHLHFVVIHGDGATSIPITFSDVPEGVPLAGHFYTSGNSIH